MQMPPLLSLGIPTYKRPHRLKNLLEKILQQKYIHDISFEIVVSDNNSQDETKEIVQSFQNKLPIVYSPNEINIGSAMNFHTLLSKCTGKYLWLVPDDDDFTYENSIYNVYKILENNPQLSALFLNHRVVELDTGKVNRDNVFNLIEDIYIKDGKNIFKYLEDAHLLTGIAVVVDRKKADTSFNLRYCQTTWLSPLSMAVSACAQGEVMITHKTWVDLGAGDPASWRKLWTHIYYQEMGELLLECIQEYSFPKADIQQMLKIKVNRVDEVMNWKQLILSRQKVRAARLAAIYGWGVVLRWLLQAPFKLCIQLLKK